MSLLLPLADDWTSENPFQYDLNDLDLDAICQSLERELHEISAVRLLFHSKIFYFTHERGPFEPAPCTGPDDVHFQREQLPAGAWGRTECGAGDGGHCACVSSS